MRYRAESGTSDSTQAGDRFGLLGGEFPADLDESLFARDERVDNVRVEMFARTVDDDGPSHIMTVGILIGALRAQGIVNIGQRDNSAAQRNIGSRQPARISAAVPAFVMGRRDITGHF